MNHVERLLKRLEDIGQSLAQSGHGLALLGLGSVGKERARLDDYSDLDFFAIVQSGHKHDYLTNLSWLSDIAPIAYAFMNTVDGYKLLYADGIFCEMAVFEPQEMETIPFAEGALVWHSDEFDLSLATPRVTPHHNPSSDEWLLGEALTNLYVGLGRYQRGEKLIAQRFIQHFAVDRVLDLASRQETAQPAFPDIYNYERRFEQRFPNSAQALPNFIQGYERSIESALAILEYLDTHYAINQAIKTEILKLAKR